MECIEGARESVAPVMDAAYDFVDTMIPRADVQAPFPAWFGWALREAFVAGAKWQRENSSST